MKEDLLLESWNNYDWSGIMNMIRLILWTWLDAIDDWIYNDLIILYLNWIFRIWILKGLKVFIYQIINYNIRS